MLDAQRKRSSDKVREVSRKAGKKSVVRKICETVSLRQVGNQVCDLDSHHGI